jgi:hypothetical protein
MSLYSLSRSDSFAVRLALTTIYASSLNALRPPTPREAEALVHQRALIYLGKLERMVSDRLKSVVFWQQGRDASARPGFVVCGNSYGERRDRGEEMENRGLRRSSPLACPKDGRASSRPHDRPGCNRLGDIGHTNSNSLNDARLSPARNPALPPRRPRCPRPSPCSSQLCLPRPRLRPLRVSARRRAAPRCWR